MAPMVNCVIFASEPVGVHDVSALEGRGNSLREASHAVRVFGALAGERCRASRVFAAGTGTRCGGPGKSNPSAIRVNALLDGVVPDAQLRASLF